ncbi:hypothetical protein L1049_003398 [Liquidambar formosana]|uniref:Gnk2-homologous domain-containing protein n=1 Tax=Liquidambar formosana TaxID=63359 RepID=A0AAP0QX97_LIQFO
MLALIHGLISRAPYTDLMFATDEIVGVNGNQYGYGLVQCSRDISSDGCSNCLGGLTNDITVYCQGRRGWHILAPSCRIRYEEYPFYEKSPAPGRADKEVDMIKPVYNQLHC